VDSSQVSRKPPRVSRASCPRAVRGESHGCSRANRRGSRGRALWVPGRTWRSRARTSTAATRSRRWRQNRRTWRRGCSPRCRCGVSGGGAGCRARARRARIR
jgi:hypothetical protein